MQRLQNTSYPDTQLFHPNSHAVVPSQKQFAPTKTLLNPTQEPPTPTRNPATLTENAATPTEKSLCQNTSSLQQKTRTTPDNIWQFATSLSKPYIRENDRQLFATLGATPKHMTKLQTLETKTCKSLTAKTSERFMFLFCTRPSTLNIFNPDLAGKTAIPDPNVPFATLSMANRRGARPTMPTAPPWQTNTPQTCAQIANCGTCCIRLT